MARIELVVIDPQRDFCEKGMALYVPGAEADMDRLAAMIIRLTDKISDINCTLDSHPRYHIAHPIFWKDRNGNHPPIYTDITAQHVRDGVWTPSTPSHLKIARHYTEQLEKNGRYSLKIWPPHCLIGSPGHNVYPPLFEAFKHWEEKRGGWVNYVTKGSNPFTEHYSAIMADVPDPEDLSTQINTRFLEKVMKSDIILLAGEAKSHCLACTGEDAANYFKDDTKFIGKTVLLEDATSAVTGYESRGDEFVAKMVKRGMQRATTLDFMS